MFVHLKSKLTAAGTAVAVGAISSSIPSSPAIPGAGNGDFSTGAIGVVVAVVGAGIAIVVSTGNTGCF